MHLPASQFLLKESETINDKLDITSMFAVLQSCLFYNINFANISILHENTASNALPTSYIYLCLFDSSILITQTSDRKYKHTKFAKRKMRKNATDFVHFPFAISCCLTNIQKYFVQCHHHYHHVLNLLVFTYQVILKIVAFSSFPLSPLTYLKVDRKITLCCNELL